MTISVDGNELFDNIEEFKKAFLPLHQLGTQASNQIIKNEKDKLANQALIKKHVDALEQDIQTVDELFNSKTFLTAEDLFDHVDEDGDESEQVLALRSNLTIIKQLLRQITPLEHLNDTIVLDSEINDELQQDLSILKERCNAAQEKINKIQSQETKFYSRYKKHVDDARIREEKEQQILQELAEKKAAKVLRRKGIMKRLLLTSIFVLLVAGYLYKQMF